MAGQNEKNSPRDNSFLIFVTGLPSKTTVQTVLDHFSQFGQVIMYQQPTGAKCQRVLQNHPSVNIKRGFCILQTASEITYKQVLSYDEPFLGRNLAIGPFRQGSQLWNHNEQVSSRRVIVKKVPTSVTEEILKEFLENEFGGIRRMYCYAAESSQKAAKREKTRKTNTYSVEFVQENSAIQAAKTGQICMKSYPLIIEKFEKKTPSVFGEIPSKFNKSSFDTYENNSRNLSNGQYQPRNLLTSSEYKHQQKYNQQTKPIGQSDTTYHHVRPTNKQYFLERDNFSTLSQDSDSSNYQVRVCVPKQRLSFRRRTNLAMIGDSNLHFNVYSRAFRQV